MQIDRDGKYCLSQRGNVINDVNVALRAAVSASSTANAIAHGPSKAVDGQEATFWASRLSVSTEVVELSVDWGQAEHIKRVDVAWEFPAKAFSILTADVHSSFEEVFRDIDQMPMRRAQISETNN